MTIHVTRGFVFGFQVVLPTGRDWSALTLSAVLRDGTGRVVASFAETTAPQDDGTVVKELRITADQSAAIAPGAYTTRIRVEEVGIEEPIATERITVKVEAE